MEDLFFPTKENINWMILQGSLCTMSCSSHIIYRQISKTQKKSDFGGFQSPELRGKKSKIFQIDFHCVTQPIFVAI
jgi:hypothetical protein